VRQLENVVERALAFSQGKPQVELHDLTPDVDTPLQDAASSGAHGTAEVWFPDDGLDFEGYISGVELSLIKQSLERTQGNKRQAAKLLKLKRTTLIEKLKRLESPGRN
jgi:DNA-binding NtrC family response regulator